MKDTDWDILIALRKYNNITKAAEALFLPQPTLTKRVKQIEDEFGVVIAHRTVKGIMLTPEGEYLAEQAAVFRDMAEKTREYILQMGENIQGTLRLGVASSFARYILPKLLMAFKERYPLVEFLVHTNFSSKITRMLLNHEIHVGFVRGDHHFPGGRHMLQEDYVTVINSEPWLWEQLPDMPRVEFHLDSVTRDLLDHWWFKKFNKPARVAMQVDYAETCLEMVRHKLGYGIFLSETMLNKFDGLHVRRAAFPDGRNLTRRTWMFYDSAAYNTGLVKVFVDFVKEYFSVSNR